MGSTITMRYNVLLLVNRIGLTLDSSKTIPVESKSFPIDKWHLLASLVPWTHSLVYLDDIIICTFEKHTHRLWLVFDRIRTAGLKLKPH